MSNPIFPSPLFFHRLMRKKFFRNEREKSGIFLEKIHKITNIQSRLFLATTFRTVCGSRPTAKFEGLTSR